VHQHLPEVHQLLRGVVLLVIKQMVELAAVGGRAQSYPPVVLVALVALVQMAKVQLQLLRPIAVLQPLVQLNKQVDPIGGVQDGL
jgi:hypothetical protein